MFVFTTFSGSLKVYGGQESNLRPIGPAPYNDYATEPDLLIGMIFHELFKNKL